MAIIYDLVRRITATPRLDDLARGFAAEVADPAWLLGRQWQLGEHRGEDASSPVRVHYTCRQTPVESPSGGDPVTTPAEAIVESEPFDWWTPGRRVGLGRLAADAAGQAGVAIPADDRALLLTGLPVPYDTFTGFDGRALWARREELGLDPSWFGPAAPPEREPEDLWDPTEFGYSADFTAGGVDLAVRRHDGGDLDWYSADASGTAAAGGGERRQVYPGRVRYPGAPLPRWWQIEDSAVDIGGYPPDRSHFATLLLIDLIVNQSDDWFGFPVDALAGHIVTLTSVTVVDSFGEKWKLTPPADGWSLYATEGLGRESLVVWAAAAAPLTGPVLDEVTVGVDEDANLAWAVERRVTGRDVGSPPDPPPPVPETVDASGRLGHTYEAATRTPPGWHPYVIEPVDGRRRFVQARAADLTGPVPVLMPEPASDLLVVAPTHPVHQVEPAAIPVDGLRLERRAMLARATDGSPVLWTQRRRAPLLTPPAFRLHFDALTPHPPGA
ncbi:hypothetical protein [Kitasatospora sp. KL5]|uniref:hypothetical protein n=1 Tax=Kitasatospora sp. KL5 TaxID=3425125 RepID=UPI003D6F08B5